MSKEREYKVVRVEGDRVYCQVPGSPYLAIIENKEPGVWEEAWDAFKNGMKGEINDWARRAGARVAASAAEGLKALVVRGSKRRRTRGRGAKQGSVVVEGEFYEAGDQTVSYGGGPRPLLPPGKRDR